jgi:hypothetical protein
MLVMGNQLIVSKGNLSTNRCLVIIRNFHFNSLLKCICLIPLTGIHSATIIHSFLHWYGFIKFMEFTCPLVIMLQLTPLDHHWYRMLMDKCSDLEFNWQKYVCMSRFRSLFGIFLTNIRGYCPCCLVKLFFR